MQSSLLSQIQGFIDKANQHNQHCASESLRKPSKEKTAKYAPDACKYSDSDSEATDSQSVRQVLPEIKANPKKGISLSHIQNVLLGDNKKDQK